MGIATVKPVRRMENGEGARWPTTDVSCARGLNAAAMRQIAEEIRKTIAGIEFAAMRIDSVLKLYAAEMEHVKAKRRREAGVGKAR